VGNAIEFDEAADRMGVDVMRWMFAKARPEENILFGWHAADEARRELLVLWNVYAFFVTYARLVGWSPEDEAPAVGERPILDRWILLARGRNGGDRRGPASRRRRCGRHARVVCVP
jgi:isoleucyl-tRNA synthetase